MYIKHAISATFFLNRLAVEILKRCKLIIDKDEEIKIHEQWLEELGYDTETHYVDFETHKITKRIFSL